METVETLLIDRSKLFREGIKRLFSGSQFQISSEAASVEEGVELLKSGVRPQLVMLDFSEGSKDEIDCMRQLRDREGKVRLVVLTDRMCCRRLTWSLEAGADGYLLKDMSPDALKQSLSLVLLGEKVFPTDLATMLISGQIGPSFDSVPNGSGKGLSEREVQILRCLLNGYSNKVIANRLNITEGTVKVHLKGVLKKINAANRTQAAIWALNHGFGSEQQEAGSAPVALRA